MKDRVPDRRLSHGRDTRSESPDKTDRDERSIDEFYLLKKYLLIDILNSRYNE